MGIGVEKTISPVRLRRRRDTFTWNEHNVDVDFARRVSADHYVFCGNGHAGNPELKVINMIHASRLGNQSVRALSPTAANREFHFWFSTRSQDQPPSSDARKAFAKVEERVAELAAQSNGQCTRISTREL